MGRGLLVQLNQGDGKRRRSLSPVQKIQGDDPAAPEPGPSKRSRTSPISLHSWLHPGEAPRLSAHSPALHDSTSTFLSFSLTFLPPAHITSETSLAKEVRRIIRELNVPGLVGDEVMRGDEGAFQDGEGRTGKGKERAREPDHRMWAVRTLCLKEGKDGTGGENDYQLLEAYNDDGEKFGGERVLRALRDERAVDVLTVCCRWYGGDMIGPIRFQHIGLTASTSIKSLLKLVSLRDLRTTLEALDEEIALLRATVSSSDPSQSTGDKGVSGKGTAGSGARVAKYDDIDDVVRLERLVKAKEKTKASLEGRAAWAGMEAAKAA